MALAVPASAQSPSTLKIQVVISKYQGDKKISSLPYTLTLRGDGSRASLRVGTQVPIVTAPATSSGPIDKTVPTFSYRDVGTSIDCQANRVDDTQFKLDITIEDSAIASEQQAGASRPDHPSFRSFRSSNTLVLKDGQAAQYTTATDKVSGEVVKADITLTIVK
jgi:type II secretory pathway component GspD/PulD (secretin)